MPSATSEPLELAFVGCLQSLSSIRKSELGLGGEGEEGLVLCSLTSFVGLLAVSAFPSCRTVVSEFLAHILFSSILFAAYVLVSCEPKVTLGRKVILEARPVGAKFLLVGGA